MTSAQSTKAKPLPRRGRWQLLALLSMVLLPMLLATAMYYWQFWVPDNRTYHGDLIADGSTLNDLGIQQDPDQRWQLLVTAPDDCNDACRQLVYLARQIQIGLNRETSRASHGLASAAPLSADYSAELTREYPQLGRYALDLEHYQQLAKDRQPKLWIVDPLGNLVLSYSPESNGRHILKDLLLLLKLSQIG